MFVVVVVVVVIVIVIVVVVVVVGWRHASPLEVRSLGGRHLAAGAQQLAAEAPNL